MTTAAMASSSASSPKVGEPPLSRPDVMIAPMPAASPLRTYTEMSTPLTGMAARRAPSGLPPTA